MISVSWTTVKRVKEQVASEMAVSSSGAGHDYPESSFRELHPRHPQVIAWPTGLLWNISEHRVEFSVYDEADASFVDQAREYTTPTLVSLLHKFLWKSLKEAWPKPTSEICFISRWIELSVCPVSLELWLWVPSATTCANRSRCMGFHSRTRLCALHQSI